MPCYYPLKGWMRQDQIDGSRSFTMRTPESQRGSNHIFYMSQTLPCGGCVGCRLKRSGSWAIRCMHEASLHTDNCFITLTYAPDFLPEGNSLQYRDFQLFMKRLRECYGEGIRFYMCGEYGDEFGRPHFHALIFNFDFQDKIPFFQSPSGAMVYRSAELERLWPYGHSSIGDVTFQSAGYVARYVMKKITGSAAYNHYAYYDESGQIKHRVPEFNKMSLKPGIAADWFEKYRSDVFPHDYVIVNHNKVSVPRYYEKLEKLKDPLGFDNISYERFLLSQKRLDDSTPQRLKVKEQIAIKRLSMLKRSL